MFTKTNYLGGFVMKLNYKCLEASDEWGSPVEFSIHKEKETNRVVFFVDVECQEVHLTVK